MVAGNGQFVPVDDGVYYVAAPDEKTPRKRALRFLKTGSDTPEIMQRFEVRVGQFLTVSPDRKTILYSGQKPGVGDDLMLIKNFR